MTEPVLTVPVAGGAIITADGGVQCIPVPQPSAEDHKASDIAIPPPQPQTQTVTPTPNPATPSSILLRPPRKYTENNGEEEWKAPTLQWLEGTWSVTHSTLPMWRKAKNVRITYKIIPPSQPGGNTLLDDTVESVPTEKTWIPQPGQIKGIDTPDGDGAWHWRGKGLLKIASSKWEVLGWGERDEERWVVTWFAPSLFTPMGFDLYSDRREGMSKGLEGDIIKELEKFEARVCVELVRKEMRKVKIEY